MKACTALVLLCLTLALPARGLEDLSFLHVSDVHYPHAKAESAQTVSSLPQGPVVLEAYGVTTPAPSFAVVTGDLMEFGGGGGAWEGYLELWRTWTRPV